MGQDISLILSKEITTQVPIHITHFIRNNTLIIPIEEPWELGSLISNVVESGDYQINSYLHYPFIKLAKELKLNTFMAYHNSEWADMPDEHFEFVVLDGKIIKDSIWISEAQKLDGEILLDPSNYVDSNLLEIEISKIEHFAEYWHCRFIYEKENNLPSSFIKENPKKQRSLWQKIILFFKPNY